MAEVTAMDAAGLGLLIELRNWACAQGIELKLLNMTDHLENLLKITHLTPLFNICSVREMTNVLCLANQASLATTYATVSLAVVADVRVPCFVDGHEAERLLDKGFYEGLRAS
jgi:hypothetical protein